MTTNSIDPPRRAFPWRALGWGGVAVLLSLPLLTGMPWTLSDYVIMGLLLGAAGVSARGMALAMFATAFAQLLVGIAALAWQLGSPGRDGLYEAVMGTSVFGGMWLVAGGLFRVAAQREAAMDPNGTSNA